MIMHTYAPRNLKSCFNKSKYLLVLQISQMPASLTNSKRVLVHRYFYNDDDDGDDILHYSVIIISLIVIAYIVCNICMVITNKQSFKYMYWFTQALTFLC